MRLFLPGITPSGDDHAMQPITAGGLCDFPWTCKRNERKWISYHTQKTHGNITIVHMLYISSMEQPAEEKTFPLFFSVTESVHNLEQNYPWLYWTLFYARFVLFALVVTVVYVGIGYPVLSNTDVNGARLLLSAIMQSEAAIIAIVISLTLVAMQLVASSYSPRVARIFSSGSQMYVILQFYVISIAYTAIVLQVLQGDSGPVSPLLTFLVSFSLWFAIFLMAALVPYIKNILTLLQPEQIIVHECQRISKDTILSEPSLANPLDLIFDILHQSIMRHDMGLVKDMLPGVTEAVIRVLSQPLADTEIIEITRYYSQRLLVCAQQTIQQDDLESTRIILENLKVLVNCTISREKDEASKKVIESIQILEKAAAGKRSWNHLVHILDLLEECGKGAIEKNLVRTTNQVCVCLKKVTQDSIDSINPDELEGPFSGLAERSIEIVYAFAHLAISNNQKDTWDSIFLYLEDIWNYSYNKKHMQFVHSVAARILDVWLVAVEHSVEIPRLSAAANNAYHVRKLWDEQNTGAPDIFEYKVMRIGITAYEHDLEDSTIGAARLLADFRLLDVPGYDKNLANFKEFLKEGEKPAYQHVFDLSVTFADEKSRKP